MIVIKSDEEIRLMRQAGRIAADALAHVLERVRPGVTTKALDSVAGAYIKGRSAKPAFLGYHGYPASICVSINDEVVHGIPSSDRVIQEGDLVSIDLGVIYQGYHGDLAWTVAAGEVDSAAEKLLEVGRASLFAGIEKARPGNRLLDISAAIQQTAESAGFNVVRQYVGHGIGRALHEDPQVPNFGEPGKGILLESGLVLAIEPMVNEGVYDVYVEKDGWTVRTADGKRSVHFEHTVAVTQDGPEIMTYNENFL